MRPRLRHRQQVIGVAAQEVGVPIANEKILDRSEPDATPQFFAVEGLAQRPAREHRKAIVRVRGGEIARRRRKAIAEFVRDDDEIFTGVENAPGPDQPFDIRTLRAIGRRIKHRIELVRRERAIGLIDQLQGRNGQPALKYSRAEIGRCQASRRLE